MQSGKQRLQLCTRESGACRRSGDIDVGSHIAMSSNFNPAATCERVLVPWAPIPLTLMASNSKPSPMLLSSLSSVSVLSTCLSSPPQNICPIMENGQKFSAEASASLSDVHSLIVIRRIGWDIACCMHSKTVNDSIIQNLLKKETKIRVLTAAYERPAGSGHG